MCLNPIIKKGTSGALRGIAVGRQNIPVPCGKCAKCVRQRIRDWSIRLEHHRYVTCHPLFVTLTYRDSNMPRFGVCSLFTRRSYGIPTLFKKDVQDFFKRLRKAAPKNKLSYMAVGEYGTKYGRPHYHIILFNLALEDHHKIHKAWGHGITQAKPFRDSGAIKYIMKYVSKKGTYTYPQHREFSLSSQKMGLNYLTPEMYDYHTQDASFCRYTYPDGRVVPLPRYYKKHLYAPYVYETVCEETGEITEHVISHYSETTTYLRELADRKKALELDSYIKNNPDIPIHQCIKNLAISRLSLPLPQRNIATEVF